jgi:hypothetical protein
MNDALLAEDSLSKGRRLAQFLDDVAIRRCGHLKMPLLRGLENMQLAIADGRALQSLLAVVCKPLYRPTSPYLKPAKRVPNPVFGR